MTALPPSSSAGALRVAYVMSRFPKLTETFVLDELLALLRRGVDVQIYPLLREHESVQHPEVDAVRDRVHYAPLLSLAVLGAHLFFLCRHPLRYLTAVGRAVTWTFGSLNFMAGAALVFPKAVRFAYDLRSRQVDHVHAHFANHPALCAALLHTLTKIPYSFTAHGSDLHVDQRGLRPKILAAKFAIAISRYNRQFMIDACGPEVAAKIQVVHCGVDPRRFASSPGSTDGPLRIVCVAALRAVKGHRYLLEACRMLRDQRVAYQCELIGDGPLRSELEAQVAALGLEDTVRLLGPLPRPQVLAALQAADVAVLASCLDRDGRREGIPVSLMEAMASGIPVVASDLSGIPELVTQRGEGLLVAPGDAPALAAALAELAASPALRQQFGRAARRRIEQAFDLDSNAAQLLALIDPGAATSLRGSAATGPG